MYMTQHTNYAMEKLVIINLQQIQGLKKKLSSNFKI